MSESVASTKSGATASVAETTSTSAVPSIALARALSCATDSLSSMPPMDLLINQLQCESSEARVDAMGRLGVVAEAIGTEATLTQLLPYLASNIAMDDDEEDEILMILAEQLGKMVPSLIPGYRALPVLPILERLAAVEETVVREVAVTSMEKIVPVLLVGDDRGVAASAAPALLLAMAKRLCGADWFTAKVSAAGILPVVYQFYNDAAAVEAYGAGGGGDETNSPEDAKRELRALYKDLAEDDTPMVKRSAAKHLGKFVEAVANIAPSKKDGASSSCDDHSSKTKKTFNVSEASMAIVIKEMIPLLRSLASDEQDSVRLLAVAVAGSYAKALNMDGKKNAEVVWPVISAGCIDLSWRVRNNLAKEFTSVSSFLGFNLPPFSVADKNQHLTELFQYYAALLQDAEAEVRAAAVINVANMARLGGSELFLSHISPCLPSLGDDPVMEVRSRLAQTLMDCCDDDIRSSTLSDKVILSTIKPHIENFLNDEFAEVQLNVLTKLSRISNLLNRMDAVVQTILQMAKDKNWRVRQAVGSLFPHLADAMGMQFFQDHLLPSWLKLLYDRVADVRTSIITGMPKLLLVAGSGWIQSELLPQFVQLYDESSSYLFRITIIRCFSELGANKSDIDAGGKISAIDDHPQLMESVVTFLLKGLNDRVANVRMVSAQGLWAISKQVDEEIRISRIEPALREKLEGDDDEDCKYYAQLALVSN